MVTYATEASIHARRFLRIADPDATSLDLLEGVLAGRSQMTKCEEHFAD
jgi:hypothetical protein